MDHRPRLECFKSIGCSRELVYAKRAPGVRREWLRTFFWGKKSTKANPAGRNGGRKLKSREALLDGPYGPAVFRAQEFDGFACLVEGTDVTQLHGAALLFFLFLLVLCDPT